MPTPASSDPELLLEHSRWIQSMARRLVSESDADDLVQDTWLKVGDPSLRRPGGATRPWLARIMRNLANNRHRTQRHRRDRELLASAMQAEGHGELPAPDELVARGEQQREVVDAVLALDEPYRTTLLLRYFQGVGPHEIAAKTGKPPATVRTHLRRGIERVRVRLDERNGGDRSRWVMALASPLSELAPSLIPTALMHLLSKLALVTTVALAAAWWWQRPEASPDIAVEPLAMAPAGPTRLASLAEAAETTRASERERLSQTTPAASEAAPEEAAQAPPLGQLRIIDSSTGEPARDYQFEVTVRDGTIGAVGRLYETDSQGLVELPVSITEISPCHGADSVNAASEQFALGYPTSYPGTSASFTWEDGEAELAVKIPADLWLDLSRPAGARGQRLFATLGRATAPLHNAHGFSILREREGRHFARFAGLEARLQHGDWLHVCTADGMYAGKVAIPASLLDGTPLPISLVPVSRLELSLQHVRSSAGDPPRAQGTYQLRREGGPSVVGLARCPAAPSWAIEALEPGAYQLELRCDGYEPIVRSLLLPPSGTTRALLNLMPTGDARLSMQGTVTSTSGNFQLPLRAVAWELDGKGASLSSSAEVRWVDVGGRLEGNFTIEDVRRSRYRIVLQASGHESTAAGVQMLLDGLSCTVEPGEFPALEVNDDRPSFTAEIAARDGTTGEPVGAFSVAWIAGSVVRDAEASEGVATLRGFGEFLDGRVMVEAQGYQRVELPPEQFFSHDLKATIDLRPGWGGVAVAIERKGKSLQGSTPLAGVEVRCDGTLMGRTDDRGMLVLALPRAPDNVEFRRQGWAVTGRFSFDEAGQLDASGRMNGYLTAFMKPEQKGPVGTTNLAR